jgi:hypothetical protein
VLNDVNKRAEPTAILENIIISLWVRRDEINPDKSRVVKYPRDINRKREPASAWLKASSDLTPGIKGARIMRDRKFTKKIEVSSKRGVS